MKTREIQNFRCACGKLLFKSPGFVGVVEVKCRRCGRLASFQQKSEAPSIASPA